MSLPEIKIQTTGSRGWRERADAYVRLVRLDRPIGIFLLMWPALWALWLAGDGHPPWHVALIFVLGVVLMRSAGCAINDYADRNFDPHVARTRMRPLAQGIIEPAEALGVFLLLTLVSFGLVLLLNWQTIAMSFVAAALAVVYPFMKRYTHVPQVFLGAAFGWAVPMAFTAIHGSVPGYAWLVFAAAVVWALIYDTEYAMVDREDDLKIGIKSTAIWFGRYDRLIIGLLQISMLALLVSVGLAAERGWAYFIGLVVAAAMAVHQLMLIRRREPKQCFVAFLNNNYFGMAIFLGLVADYILHPAAATP
jgi:4-hydroxybenzoate polyprenyltransferase